MVGKAKSKRWAVRDGLTPLPGVGPGPMTDEEFEEASATYLQAFPALASDAVRKSGIYEQRAVPEPETPAGSEE